MTPSCRGEREVWTVRVARVSENRGLDMAGYRNSGRRHLVVVQITHKNHRLDLFLPVLPGWHAICVAFPAEAVRWLL